MCCSLLVFFSWSPNADDVANYRSTQDDETFVKARLLTQRFYERFTIERESRGRRTLSRTRRPPAPVSLKPTPIIAIRRNNCRNKTISVISGAVIRTCTHLTRRSDKANGFFSFLFISWFARMTIACNRPCDGGVIKMFVSATSCA